MLLSTKEARHTSLESILGQISSYYLWLLALTLAFSSSILFFKLYAKSRGTPLGKVAFFISLNSLLWSIAIAFLSVPSIMMVGVYTDVFLLAAILAGVASIFGAYYRGIIQWLLTPSSDEEPRDLRVYYILCGLAFAVALFSVIFSALNIPLWIGIENGKSMMGDLVTIILAGSLISLTRSRLPRKLAYLGLVFSLIIGFLVLAGNWLLIRFLVNPFQSGHTSDLTAVGLIAISLAAVLSKRRGLKTWVAQFIPVTSVLIIATLAVVGYALNLPTLYTEGAYVGISTSMIICFLFIGSAQIWYAWNRR